MLGFAQHLPALGWDVSVLSCGNYPYEPIDPDLSIRVPSGVAVYEVGYPEFAGWRLLLSRLACRAGIWYEGRVWLKTVWQIITKLTGEKAPDVILTSGPPHLAHMLGRRAKRLSDVAWVADFRDPWVAGEWRGTVPSLSDRRPGARLSPRLTWSLRMLRGQRKLLANIIPSGTINSSPSQTDTMRRPCLHTSRVAMGRFECCTQESFMLDAIRVRSWMQWHVLSPSFNGSKSTSLVESKISTWKRNHVFEDLEDACTHEDTFPVPRRVAPLKTQTFNSLSTRRADESECPQSYTNTSVPGGRYSLSQSPKATQLGHYEESGIRYALAPPRDVNAIAAAVIKVIGLASVPHKMLPAQAARFTRANLAAELSGISSDCSRSRTKCHTPQLNQTAEWAGNSELVVAK